MYIYMEYIKRHNYVKTKKKKKKKDMILFLCILPDDVLYLFKVHKKS